MKDIFFVKHSKRDPSKPGFYICVIKRIFTLLMADNSESYPFHYFLVNMFRYTMGQTGMSLNILIPSKIKSAAKIKRAIPSIFIVSVYALFVKKFLDFSAR